MKPLIILTLLILPAISFAQDLEIAEGGVAVDNRDGTIKVILFTDGGMVIAGSIPLIRETTGNPYPEPSDKEKEAVDDLLKIEMYPEHAKQDAKDLNACAEMIERQSVLLDETDELKEWIQEQGKDREGEYEGFGAAANKAASELMGDFTERKLTSSDANALRVMAWAIWEAGHAN